LFVEWRDDDGLEGTYQQVFSLFSSLLVLSSFVVATSVLFIIRRAMTRNAYKKKREDYRETNKRAHRAKKSAPPTSTTAGRILGIIVCEREVEEGRRRCCLGLLLRAMTREVEEGRR